MAFNVQQINPLDLQPSVGVGVGLPFSSNQVFNITYTTQEAIKTNLINYFLTGESERFFNPTFGAGIGAVLFNQMQQDTNTYLLYLRYSIRNTNVSDELLINFEQ
jgi:hypothetical protein